MKKFLTLRLPSKHPKEMYLLAITEMCQRFSFWGIAYLLVLYLVQYHKFTDAGADNIYGLFTGVTFVLPVIGGWIADRTNYRQCVIIGSIISAIGCFLMSTRSLEIVYPALLFIAVGGCIFTPSVYAMLSSVYYERHHLRDAGFSIYYSAVNLGVFIALIVLGIFAQAKSWSAAFVIAGFIQLLALIPFFKVLKSNFIAAEAVQHEALKRETASRKAKLKKHEIHRIIVIGVLAFFSIIFWVAYNQGGSSMTIFALNFTDRNFFGYQVPPSWLLSTETLYLIILAFPLSAFYLYLARKKQDPTPPMKVVFSLISVGICFAIMAFGALQIPTHAQRAFVSPWYLILAYAFMALGEMLIMPIGLSLVTHLSPRRFTALLVGIWYLCIGIAFYLGGMLAGYMSSLRNLTGFFAIFVVIAFAAAIILQFLVKKLNAMRHMDSL